MERPLLWVAVGLAAGGYALASGGALFAAGLFVLLLALGLIRWTPAHPFRDYLAFATLAYTLGGIVWAAHHSGPGVDALGHRARYPPVGRVVLEGWARQAPIIYGDTNYARFVLVVDHIGEDEDRAPVSGKVLVRWSEPGFRLHTDMRVRVSGALGQRLGPVNHGLNGLEDHFRRQGIHSELRVRGADVEALGHKGWSPMYWASRLRAWEADIFRRAVPEEALPFVLTVWLGERGQIAQETYENFLRAGTAHILAVSGVHVGIIFISLQLLLRPLIGSRRARVLLIVVMVFAFALAAGARVSSLRAATMIAIYLAAEWFDREGDPPTALSIAAIMFLLWRPGLLFDLAFLLSFSSVASILLFTPPVERLLAWSPAPMQRAVAPTLAVQVLPLPIAAHYFHVLPLIAPLVNLLVVPLLTAVLWLCFVTVGLGALSPAAAALFGHALAPLVTLIHWLSERAATAPLSHLPLSSPTAWAVAAYWLAALLLAFSVYSTRRRRVLAAGLVLLCCVPLLWGLRVHTPGIDFLDVGHGDAIFIRTPGGGTMLVDGGDRSDFNDLGQRVVLPFLLSQGVTRLDYVLVSHAHRDHVGGLFAVLERLHVGAVLLGPPSGQEIEEELLALCARREVPVRRLAQGDHLDFAGATLEVLFPPAELGALSINDQSLVVRLRWPGMDALLTGDVEREAEMMLLEADLRAALLKVPHHGSTTSSLPEFVQAVAPAAAVVPTGMRGQRVSARSEVMQRYADLGIPTWRTDLEGGVRVRGHGGVLQIEGARAARGWPRLAPGN